jgi:hypothetical protein
MRYIAYAVMSLILALALTKVSTELRAQTLPKLTAPVVAELFTSQSCSSCPAADKVLAELATHPNIITLGCHVTYWNHLSWSDTLSLETCTQRQNAYAAAEGSKRIFTPELRVNGGESLVGSRRASVLSAIATSKDHLEAIQIDTNDKGDYTVVLPRLSETQTLQLILLTVARPQEQAMAAGENEGRTIHYTSPVTAIKTVATYWPQTGRFEIMKSDIPTGTQSLALLAQEASGTGLGKIRAAGQKVIAP